MCVLETEAKKGIGESVVTRQDKDAKIKESGLEYHVGIKTMKGKGD